MEQNLRPLLFPTSSRSSGHAAANGAVCVRHSPPARPAKQTTDAEPQTQIHSGFHKLLPPFFDFRRPREKGDAERSNNRLATPTAHPQETAQPTLGIEHTKQNQATSVSALLSKNGERVSREETKGALCCVGPSCPFRPSLVCSGSLRSFSSIIQLSSHGHHQQPQRHTEQPQNRIVSFHS